jgi:hypothetical protein
MSSTTSRPGYGQAYTWSRGRAIFASGSPFPAFVYEGRELVPGQGNNAYIFPGVGLGIVASGSRRVTGEMFAEAARTLAQHVRQQDLERGCLFPPLERIREVSAHIAQRTKLGLGLVTATMPVGSRSAACHTNSKPRRVATFGTFIVTTNGPAGGVMPAAWTTSPSGSSQIGSGSQGTVKCGARRLIATTHATAGAP